MLSDYWIGCSLVGVMVGALVSYIRSSWSRYRIQFRRHAFQSLSELFLFVSLFDLLLWWCIGLLLSGVTVWLLSGSLIITLLASTLAACTPLWIVRRIKYRRAERFRRQLPDAVLLLSSSLKSGSSLNHGFALLVAETPAPLAQEFALVDRSVRLGESLQQALNQMLKRLPSEDLERLCIALMLAAESGGQQAELLEEMSSSMRQKQQLQQRIEALTAQGRLQGRVMTCLPLLMVMALWFIEQPTMLQLATHPLGWVTTAIVVILLLAGYWVMKRIVRIEVPV